MQRKAKIQNEKSFNKIKRNRYILLSICLAFVLPILFFIGTLRKSGIYPYGEKTLLLYDMFDQLLGFMASIKYIGQGGNTIFFSGSRSLGGNYLGLFAYYMGGPLSYGLKFFSVEKMPKAIKRTFPRLFLVGLCEAHTPHAPRRQQAPLSRGQNSASSAQIAVLFLA